MPAKRLWTLLLSFALLTSSLLACDLPTLAANNKGTPGPSATSTSPSTPQLNVWSPAGPGIDVRTEHWKSEGNNEDTVTIVRCDPQRVRLSVGYQPDAPLTMSEWAKLSGGHVVINGGYFDQHNRPTGLLVANGHAAGTSYEGFGGMLSVDAQGHLSLRSLRTAPYDPSNEQLQQATQSSPILMLKGKRTEFSANAASDRRSVVAIDKQGRLLLIASPSMAFSLDELADLLAASDLGLDTALNLDGGASTGLFVNTSQQKVNIDAFTTLPIVIVVK